MPLEAADKAIICQQDKHHHDLFDADLQYDIHCWVFWKTLVDLRLMPNAYHMATKCSVRTAL